MRDTAADTSRFTALTESAASARTASRVLASTSTATKNAVLRDLAAAILAARADVLDANARDMAAARESGLADAKLRRLELTEAGLEQMAEGLNQLAELPDPVGAVTRDATVPSGLRVKKVRCPLGVIMMIYEARPGVTIDAFALCFKAGNACILKGGREASESNAALAALARTVLSKHSLPSHAITAITTSDRDEIKHLLTLDESIDLVIPRGGRSLIDFVHEHARIPTVQHFNGVCHIYVAPDADLPRAIEICATAKASAPATCNATACVLVARTMADQFIPALAERVAQDNVTIHADTHAMKLAAGPHVVPATEADWGHEYLSLDLAVRVVADMEEAIRHVDAHGTRHTEAILTTSDTRAAEFTRRVDASCVITNASTRFNDGFQLGLGAEIGISTTKIHAFGPMGLEELTTQRFIVEGTGQTR